ncbi:amino acid ABC transporter permease [Pelagibacterium xiamenense]|uniref:amino acid ABC transporter permease n=1 Tax=Pelagibacterium xiamenense TaxID=2901140 RepID=UPI001E480DDC|nr:ABC transporter permease subunit [Pelagibacterium xiamenense]MCD7060878.1 ABC transporter permease subunit [Pelagibacterium xiamenense]
MTDVKESRSGVPGRSAAGTSLIYNPTFRGIVYQVLLVGGVVLLFWWLQSNAAYNLGLLNKTVDFGFLSEPSGFQIQFSLIPYDRASSYAEVYLVGILNTLLVAAVGIVFATIFGFVMGIARLSPNFIIRTLAMLYVEIVRNVPLLLQLLFWYFLLINALPAVRQSIALPGHIFLNQRGIFAPALVTDARFLIVVAAVAVAAIAAAFWRKRTLKRIEETGERRPVWVPMLAIFAAICIVGYFVSGAPIQVDVPALAGFNFAGGFTIPPELAALTFGLIVYTGAFIAEIVRAGIQSVNYGQVEAAAALGLKDGDRMRLVIVPQALRVIVPPLTSQYLNLTKNSSLGAAIGFPELVNVFMGTALNQSGRAIEIVALTMAVYLTFSLATSLFMNWYNARVRLVER